MFAIDEGRRRKPDLEDALAAGVDADEQCSIAFMNETEAGHGEHDRLREAAVGRPQVFETRSSRGRKGRDKLAGCLTERAERLGSAGNGFRQRARTQEGEAGAVGEAELARGIDQERGRGRRDEGCDACVRKQMRKRRKVLHDRSCRGPGRAGGFTNCLAKERSGIQGLRGQARPDR